MHRLALLLFLTLILAAAPRAQEAEPEPAPETGEETQAEDEESDPLADVTDEEIEELLGLDEEYGEIEDDFDPTEEVRFEQSIPFPVDI